MEQAGRRQCALINQQLPGRAGVCSVLISQGLCSHGQTRHGARDRGGSYKRMGQSTHAIPHGSTASSAQLSSLDWECAPSGPNYSLSASWLCRRLPATILHCMLLPLWSLSTLTHDVDRGWIDIYKCRHRKRYVPCSYGTFGVACSVAFSYSTWRERDVQEWSHGEGCMQVRAVQLGYS